MSIESTAKAMIRNHGLARVTLSLSGRDVIAKAWPASGHPAVARRRQEALEKLAAAKGPALSISDVENASARSMHELCTVRAPTVEDALDAISAQLKKGDK